MVVTDAVWLDEPPSERVRAFWEREYPDMQTMAARRALVSTGGLTSHGDFALPASDWDNYYRPLEARVAALRAGRPSGALARVLDATDEEIAVRREGAASYGYGCFVMGRPDDEAGVG